MVEDASSVMEFPLCFCWMPLPASCRLQDLCHGMLCVCVCVMHWRVVNFYLVPNPCFCSYLASPSISFTCQIWISNLNLKVLSKRWVGIYRCIWRRKSFLVRDPPALTKLALLKNGGRWQEIERWWADHIISIERIFQKGWSADFPEEDGMGKIFARMMKEMTSSAASWRKGRFWCLLSASTCECLEGAKIQNRLCFLLFLLSLFCFLLFAVWQPFRWVWRFIFHQIWVSANSYTIYMKGQAKKGIYKKEASQIQPAKKKEKKTKSKGNSCACWEAKEIPYL